MMTENKILKIARRIQAIAQSGLHFTEDDFDRDRYEELRLLSVRLVGTICNTEPGKLSNLFTNETGFQTPKVDIRSVVIKDGKILMAREKLDGKYSIPGGFADINYSPSEVAVKEVREETAADHCDIFRLRQSINPENMSPLTNEEQKRYHRQLIVPQIGEDGQELLKKASVLVIGAGGLGSPVLMYLAAAGVGRIGIVDSDELTISNLQRQILYVTGDVTRLKAETAAEKLRHINPHITVTAYPVRFTEENAGGILAGYDIAVDCSDNYSTRYTLSDATLRAGIPMVYGAVSEFMGQASVFNYRGGPSYRDLYPEEMHLATADKPVPPGVIGPLPGIIGAVQACEVIKIITGAGNVLSGRLLQTDALNLRTEIISI